jgi:hypothetical protein
MSGAPAARWLLGSALLLGFTWFGVSRSYPLIRAPLEVALVLEAGRSGPACPLVTTGRPNAGDLLYVRYVGATTVVFGYDSWGSGGPESAPVEFAPGTVQPLVIQMPSLAAPPRVDRRAHGPLRVVYAGRAVLSGNVHFFGRAPQEIFFGVNPIGGTVANTPLSGRLISAGGRNLVGQPAALFPWHVRLGHWPVSAPLSFFGAIAVTVAAWLALPVVVRWGGAHVWCRRPEPVFAGHPRPPHLTFALVGAASTACFVAVITGFTFRLIEPESFGQFYDYQIRSLLAGRLDVPEEALSSEAFRFEGKYYGYFGPTPALQRLPLALAGVAFGRLSRALMVCDYLACLVAAYAILIHACRLLSRRATWPTRTDVVLLVGGAGLGSSLFFLGSRAYIYHEAILCGAACALWSVWASLRWLAAPERHRWWILSLACGLLAVHARPPAGLFALGLLGLAAAVICVRRWRGPRRGSGAALRTPALVGLLSVAGVLSFSALSYLKFRSFEGAPLKYHVQYHPARLANLAGGNFHLGNVPFGFGSYLWHPNLTVRPIFPYFYLQGRDPGESPGVHIDLAENVLALPYAMPACVGLAALAGGIALLRWPAARVPFAALAAAALPLAIALFAAVAVSHRYTADFVPPLVSAAAFGLAGLPLLPVPLRRLVSGGAALLTGAAVILTFAFTLHYQGEGVWGVPDEVKARYLSLRQITDQFLGFSRP